MSKILYSAGTLTHIENFHLPYIEALREDGHKVTVMASGEGADINMPFVKKILSPKNLLLSLRVRRLIRREKFDVLILNTTLASFVVRLALGKKRRPRVINFVHGYMFKENPTGIKDRIFLLAEGLMRHKTDDILVMNSEDYRIAKRYKLCIGEVKMTRGMGARVREKSRIPPEKIRKLLNSESEFVLCYVGELCELKNQKMLIRALPIIKEQIPESALWLIGEGRAKAELRELAQELGIADSVVFLGKRKDPCDYIRASDLYVSASKKEGLPFNILEALGCGKTVIATDVKGQRDIIEDGISGILYPSESVTELVRLVCAVYNGEIQIDSANALERYAKFCFDTVFEKTYGVMRELIEK